MITRAKPYTIVWPFTKKTAEDIDQTFDILFKQAEVNAASGGILPVGGGGTGLGSFTKGDLLYADTPTTIAGLHDVAAGNVLLSGGVGLAPAYGKVGLATHVSGILPIANGGTGSATALGAFNNLSPLTTKGDLLAHTGVDNVRVPVGVNGQVLVADSGAAAGVAWGDPTSTHEILQHDVHTDAATQTRQLGDLIQAQGLGAAGDFWGDGAPIDFLSSGLDTGGALFWGDGAPIAGVTGGISGGDVLWQRLPIGPSGSLLQSNGTTAAWVTDIGEIVASGQPSVKVYKTSNQTIADGLGTDDPVQGGTRITFDSEEFDNDDFHDPGVNPARLTVPTGKGGVYLIVGQTSWEDMTFGVRAAAWIYRNGVRRAIAEVPAPDNALPFSFTVATFQLLVDGDYIELFVQQRDAAPVAILGDAVDLSLTQLAMVKIA